MEKIRNGRHHYVPVTYLKSWADETTGLVGIHRFGVNGLEDLRSVSPKSILFERGLYDIPAHPYGIEAIDFDFLEKNIYADVEESLFTKLRLELIDKKNLSTDKWFSVAHFAVNLLFRNPRYKSLCDQELPKLIPAGDTLKKL